MIIKAYSCLMDELLIIWSYDTCTARLILLLVFKNIVTISASEQPKRDICHQNFLSENA